MNITIKDLKKKQDLSVSVEPDDTIRTVKLQIK